MHRILVKFLGAYAFFGCLYFHAGNFRFQKVNQNGCAKYLASTSRSARPGHVKDLRGWMEPARHFSMTLHTAEQKLQQKSKNFNLKKHGASGISLDLQARCMTEQT